MAEETASLTQLLHGSFVERYSVCSRPECKCHQGERHGPRRYLVVNEDGNQRQKYVPKACVEAVLEGLAQKTAPHEGEEGMMQHYFGNQTGTSVNSVLHGFFGRFALRTILRMPYPVRSTAILKAG